MKTDFFTGAVLIKKIKNLSGNTDAQKGKGEKLV